MKNLRFYWTKLCLVLGLLMVLTACDKDNGSSNDSGGSNGSGSSSVPDPEGTIILSMRNANNGETVVNFHNNGFGIGKDDNFCGSTIFYGSNSYSYLRFASIGKVSGLGSIKQIPTSGWTTQIAVMPGYGYVVKYIYEAKGEVIETDYMRVYVVDYITSATSGGVIGANIKYQYPFEP